MLSAKWWPFVSASKCQPHFELLTDTPTPHPYRFNSLWLSDASMSSENLVNIGSGNGLLPDGTKPLPEPMLTYHP